MTDTKRICKRVFLIGIDGAGTYFKDADTPCMDEIFSKGAVTYEAETALPTISAQCWGAMLIGVTPDVHGLTNGQVESFPYPTDSKFPTVFKRIREKYPDAEMASFANWEGINVGLVEHNLGVNRVFGSDDELIGKMLSYLDENDPTFFFVQFDSVDGAGHGHGYGSKKYLAQLSLIDSYVGKIYKKLEERGLLEDSLFLVTTDHGGTEGGNHGGMTEKELIIFFGAAGECVEHGSIGEMYVGDTTAIVLTALGIDVPQYDANGFSGQLPAGIFKDAIVPIRQKKEKIKYEVVHKPTPVGTIGQFIDPEKIELALFLDGNANDVTGRHETAVRGMLKYYSVGVYGECAELGARGNVTVPDLKFGDKSFSVSMWIDRDGSVPGEAQPGLFCTKNRTEDGAGMICAYDNLSLEFKILDGIDGLFINGFTFPANLELGWMNITLVVDREENTVTLYLNFGDPKTQKMSEELRGLSFDGDVFTVGNDSSGCHNDYMNTFVDDFILFNHALTPEEVGKLRDYYGK